MLAPPDHPAGRSDPRNNTTSTALASQSSRQVDTQSSSSSQPTANLQPNQQQHSQAFTHAQSPVIQYLLRPVDNSDDDSPAQEDQQPPPNGERSVAPPSPAALAMYTQPFTQPSPLPSHRSTPTSTQSFLPQHQQHQQYQQQQHEYSIPESMGYESIGDFAYISTFPENDATSSAYEMQQQPYPDSFQQMQEVQHLNRAFSPQPTVPHQNQHQHRQQSNRHQHQSQQQQQYHQQYQPEQQQQQRHASYPPPPTAQSRAYSEPIIHVYPEPELVDTRVNEINAAAVLSTSEGRSLSYRSSACSSSHSSPIKPTIRKRNRTFWIGGAVVITLIMVVTVLVVVMKMNDPNDNNNNSDNTNSDNRDSQQPPHHSTVLPPPPAWPPRPTPTPTSGPPSSISGPQISPPPLPSFPAKNRPCPEFFCMDYFDAYQKTCSLDSAYRACATPCLTGNGVYFFCDIECRDTNLCFIQGAQNANVCRARCGSNQ